ncbi:MAG TPA: hypothetical protein VNJ03_01455 [Vicinamibacterales bacterium]|nr:hypothetical protein [Vicinamibacterales bacterium]
MKMKSSTQAAPLDPIGALEAAIVAASEQSWEWNGVPHKERAALRPGVAAIAKNAADQLRSEHAARTGAKP